MGARSGQALMRRMGLAGSHHRLGRCAPGMVGDAWSWRVHEGRSIRGLASARRDARIRGPWGGGELQHAPHQCWHGSLQANLAAPCVLLVPEPLPPSAATATPFRWLGPLHSVLANMHRGGLGAGSIDPPAHACLSTCRSSTRRRAAARSALGRAAQARRPVLRGGGDLCAGASAVCTSNNFLQPFQSNALAHEITSSPPICVFPSVRVASMAYPQHQQQQAVVEHGREPCPDRILGARRSPGS